MKTPRLKRIDLQKAHQHECPGVVADGKTEYLARIGGQFFAGTFSRQWYGLDFQGWHGMGYQFDAPGENASTWEELWEIRPVFEK
jgi:hypothetical protein